MKLYSLRRATLFAVIAPLVAAVGLASVSALWVSERAINGLRDDQMQQEAKFLALLARHEAGEGELIGVAYSEDAATLLRIYGTRTGFRIWSGAKVVAQSTPAPALPGKPPPPGFSMATINGERWRTFAVHDPAVPLVVEVNETIAGRAALNRQIIGSLALPLLVLTLVVGGIAYAQVAAALRPMRRISAALDARQTDDFRPLAGHRIPSEIAPMFEAINRLLARLGQTLQREREFTDNAAHELRTPLAVLKLRAQIAIQSLAGDSERQGQFDQLVAATDRATGVVEQLLVLNRIYSGGVSSIDLSQLVADVCRQAAPEALARRQNFGADIAPDVRVDGHPDAVGMMLRNLVENAIRYTPQRGRITASLVQLPDGCAEFHVRDNGPGIPAAERESIFDRFARLDTSQSGSGLGLAIVRRIVELHGGTISLDDSPPRGLDVKVVLPCHGAA
jgi:two-component system sensor histidine kinase QseC